MNKLVKSSALLGFVLLYLFALGADTYVASNQTCANTSNHSGSYKNHATNLFSHTNQSVESVYNFTSFTVSEPKKFAKIYAAVLQLTETILESKFIQYAAAESSFPLKFTKQDIIYPFHSFL